MPRLILTPPAVAGIDRCCRFLETFDESIAAKAALTIARHLNRIADAPERGRRVGGHSELREAVIPFGQSGYIALYRYEAADDAVYILALRHQREAGY